MRVFVTGGTGLLGNNVIRKLCERNDQVLALVRGEPDPEVFAGLEVEFCHAELAPPAQANSGNSSFDHQPTDPASAESDQDAIAQDEIAQAIESCDAVIHSAAMIHLGWKHVDESIMVNRDGTLRIVNACLKHNKRLVHVGTVNTLAVGGPQTLADENTPLGHAGGQVDCAYVRSKRAAVETVMTGVSKGLDAVIVHPGFMLGPWDWKPSSGRMMLEVGRGWKPLAPSGGCSLCDVRDVADAVVAALSVDCASGRNYVLAGHNWTYLKLWTEMAKRMGGRPPLRATGPGIEYLAGLAGDIWTLATGKEPDVNSAGVEMSAQFHWYSSRRAQDELGYQIRDADETLSTAAEWIKQRFVLPRDESSS